MDILYIILGGMLTLSILVTVHEFGHYWVARRCGVAVLRFSIGFGKPFFSWRDRFGTEFAFAPILLGGYVKMHGEGPPGEATETEAAAIPPSRAFSAKSLPKRAAIVAAGPGINLLFAFFIYWLLFAVGITGYAPIVAQVQEGSVAAAAGLEEGDEVTAVDGVETNTWTAVRKRLLRRAGKDGDILFMVRREGGEHSRELRLSGDGLSDVAVITEPLAALGLQPAPLLRPEIGMVEGGSPAAAAGLQEGDLVIAADDRPMESWPEWVAHLRERPGQRVQLEVLRGGEIAQLLVVPAVRGRGEQRYGYIGVGVKRQPPDLSLQRIQRYSPAAAAAVALEQTWTLSTLTLKAIGMMVSGALSHRQLSGPVTIVRVAGESLRTGWRAYLEILALLSISLGIINLLPIPVLDGGHLLFLGAEALRGRPLSEQVQIAGQYIGILLVVGIMLLALYNDFASF